MCDCSSAFSDSETNVVRFPIRHGVDLIIPSADAGGDFSCAQSNQIQDFPYVNPLRFSLRQRILMA